MALFFHKSKPLAKQQTVLNAIRVQSSAYGQVVPLVYGQNRVSGRLIWYGDFVSIPHTSKTATGGKGGVFGGGGASQTSYTYQAAVAVLLCQGPIAGLQNVWDSKGQLALLSASVAYTVPTGGGSVTVTPPSSGTYYRDSGVTRGDAYSVNANDYGNPAGAVTLSGTQQTRMAPVGSLSAAGQYTVSGATYTFHSGDAGKVMTINYVYSVPNSNSNGQPLQQLALTLFTGARPQAPWSYLTSKHPGQDLSYVDVAYVANSALDLSASGSLPNYTYEVLGLLPFGGGITDAEPSAILTDILTNALYGAGWNASLLGDYTQLKNYCIANGIFLSPVYDAQRSAAEIVKQLCALSNSAPFWSEGKLKIVPYGDTTAVGNGATYVPNTAPVYDLTDDDFVSSGNEDPVKVTRASASEAYNDIQVEFLNRANSYNPEIAQDKDDASIALYGAHPASPLHAHEITTAGVAKLAANFMKLRAVYIRNSYRFTLGLQHALLDPMDLVMITDANLGYSKHPVRITSITEDQDGKLAVEAEDFPWSTATATLYPHQAGAGYQPNSTADPGSVNSPIIFEPSNRLTHLRSVGTEQGYQIWIGVSAANANWGGCSVWLSTDASTYQRIGVIFGAARMGTLSAALAAAADPDTTDTLSVDLSQSFGALAGGTQADCDNYRTLCFVDGEYISYQSAALTAQYKYNLGTRLRRGVFGSTIGAHAQGSAFVRLDDAVFAWVYDPTLVGSTLYFKFTSFNQHGEMEQSLANVTAYPYAVLGGPGSNGRIISTTASISVNVSGQTIIDAVVGGVNGAQVGMHVSVSAVAPLGAGWNNFSWTAWVNAANQVTVRLTNPGAVTVNLPSQVFRIFVYQ